MKGGPIQREISSERSSNKYKLNIQVADYIRMPFESCNSITRSCIALYWMMEYTQQLLSGRSLIADWMKHQVEMFQWKSMSEMTPIRRVLHHLHQRPVIRMKRSRKRILKKKNPSIILQFRIRRVEEQSKERSEKTKEREKKRREKTSGRHCCRPIEWSQ